MSSKYPGGVISKTAPTPSGPYSTDTAPGVWTLEQQAYWQKLGQWPTQGNVNPNAFIENLFSTYLYTGNGATQTITNGINLSTNGGLVWLKGRSLGYSNGLFDTIRGADYLLCSNNTDPSTSVSGIPANPWITGFNSNGFGLGSNGSANANTQTYVAWTFREQPKFFDIVTWTGDLSGNRTLNHNLASTPGCIIVKATNAADDWYVYHTSLGTSKFIYLNTTGASTSLSVVTAVTDTTFTVSQSNGFNTSGRTYIAYLFAHNAGGFGLSGTDNVISCGSYTGNGAANGQLINLGYEAQWVMIKQTNASGSGWWMTDTMRGWIVNGSSGGDANLYANASDAESSQVLGQPEAQGFRPINDNVNQSGQTYIYIAIRRGPMATPTLGTSVFSPVARTGTGAGSVSVTGIGFPPDWAFYQQRNSAGGVGVLNDRLRGNEYFLPSDASAGTVSTQYGFGTMLQDGAKLGTNTALDGGNASGVNYINYFFRRAPGFFDEVCYTGTGSNTNFSHNLGVAPQLIILKNRASATNWFVPYSGTSYMVLNGTSGGANGSGAFDLSLATASTFWLGADGGQGYNGSGQTYVAYLFATCAGVSKVGSYTGTGATLQVDCGFTGGSRFVLIKRTDAAGGWYVWDSARGIVAGNDPYFLINSTDAEVTGTDYVDTYSAGFEISSTAPSAINANGGTFIFLAIA